jgi:tetratricopeptide (TPR) repeat protein
MKLFISLLVLSLSVYVQAQNNLDSLLQKGNYLKVIDLLQSQNDSFEKNIKLGKIYHEIGDYNNAINNYLKAQKIESNESVNYLLAKTYQAKANNKQAIHYYSKIVKKDSLNYLILYKLAKLYSKTQQFDKAKIIFNKLINEDPKNPNYLYQKALLQTNLYDRANSFLKVYELDSLHTKSMLHLANFFKMIRDIDSSRLFVDKALRIDRHNIKFLPLKINDLYKQKKYKDALAYSLLLDSLSKNNVFAKQRIGLCSWKLKDNETAKDYLHQALAIDHEDKVTYYYLGLLYKDLKDYKKAKFYFTMAIIKEKPDLDNEYFNLGLIAQIEKKPRVAIKNFKEAYQNNRKNYKALFELAVMSDLYYKDKSIALIHYEDYQDRFNRINKENSVYVMKRIKDISESLFMEGKE